MAFEGERVKTERETERETEAETETETEAERETEWERRWVGIGAVEIGCINGKPQVRTGRVGWVSGNEGRKYAGGGEYVGDGLAGRVLDGVRRAFAVAAARARKGVNARAARGARVFALCERVGGMG